MKAKLASAIAKESSEALTVQAKDEDLQFDELFGNLRSLSAMKASMTSLGGESESSAVLSQSIVDHGDRIQDFARTVQISTMDTLLKKWSDESIQDHINRAKIRPLYQQVVDAHNSLKSTESIRSSESASKSDIVGMWEAKRELTPVLSKIYGHISDYADINNVQYRELLVSLNAKLAPLISQVRWRVTRNSAE